MFFGDFFNPGREESLLFLIFFNGKGNKNKSFFNFTVKAYFHGMA